MMPQIVVDVDVHIDIFDIVNIEIKFELGHTRHSIQRTL